MVTPVIPASRTARRPLAGLTALLVAALVAALAGCGGEPVSPAATASVSDSSGADSAAAAAPAPAVKRTVLLDPGHNGGNAAHAAEINKEVPDGRGGTKPCNTTGTATDAGYPEHKFTWDVALRVGDLLIANGVNAKLTRTNDTGIGPCVDVRGKLAEKYNVDAEVSIHADGGPPAGKGFHVAYPRPALNTVQGAPSLALATSIRDALSGAGLPESTYLGKAGLAPRADLAGLNWSKRPIALVECANMRNPQEAVTVSNAVGRQRYAQAIAIGIMKWLSRLPPPGSAAAAAKQTDGTSSGATGRAGSTGASIGPSASSSANEPSASGSSSGSGSSSSGGSAAGSGASSDSGTETSGTSGSRRGSTPASTNPDG